PVELVGVVAVAVDAAALDLRLGGDLRGLQRRRVGRLGGGQAARGERRVQRLPEPRRLRGRARDVQRRRRADGAEVALDVVLIGRGRVRGPLLAVLLLVP